MAESALFMTFLQAWFERDLPTLGKWGADSLATLPPCEAIKACADFEQAARVASDPDRAAAAVIAAIDLIWQVGRNFGDFRTWQDSADRLLASTPRPSPPARAALAIYRLIAGLLGCEPLQDLVDRLGTARRFVDDSGSSSLRTLLSAVEGHLYILRGDLHHAAECLKDARALAAQADTALIPRLYVASATGLIDAIRGTESGGAEALSGILHHPAVGHFPPSLILMARAHELLLLAGRADEAEVDLAAERLRRLIVPPANNQLRSYLHFSLGVADLLRGRPAEALDHARTAAEFGSWCGSASAEALPALLELQALSDLGRVGDALRHFERWAQLWTTQGFGLICSAAYLEVASIRVRQGHVEEARRAIERACAALPERAALVDLHRPAGFARELVARLLPPENGREEHISHPIQVTSFGGLRIQINGHRIHDRDWHGRRSRALLLALVVLGGTKVPLERLTDLLWPDAEGDHARQNVKVALSRLRQIARTDDRQVIPWIVTRYGQVSLVSSLCFVDALQFGKAMNEAERLDAPALAAALDLYQGDFIGEDDSEAWITAHRKALQRLYARGAFCLARKCLQDGGAAQHARIITHLERALALMPDDRSGHELLARLRAMGASPPPNQPAAAPT